MKAIEQYFHVVLFTMMYNTVLTITSVNEILVFDHSNEQYFHVVLFVFSRFFETLGNERVIHVQVLCERVIYCFLHCI